MLTVILFITDKMYFTTWNHNYIYTPGHDFKVDRYEWNKRLPGKTEKLISLSSKLVLRPVHIQHEGYYCCCMYYQYKYIGKDCFKLVISG